MNIPVTKLKALILYFCEHTDPKFLGKVKLMKLFYFVDFIHTKKFASPVTYDRYVKLGHGPIPSTIKNLVDDSESDIENSILADTINIECEPFRHIHRIVARRKLTDSDLQLFSKNELTVLENVCSRFYDKNTTFIEDVSHKEAPWKESQPLQEIPYTLAAHDSDCEVSEEEINLMIEIGQNA